MASIDFSKGQIKDRTKGYSPISYCVPKTSKSFMRECLQAHELIVSILPSRGAISPKELKSRILLYVALDKSGRQELIKQIAFGKYAEKPKEMLLENLVEDWIEIKISEGMTDKAKWLVSHRKNVILKFFKEHSIATTAGLNYDTAHKYLKWRANTNLDKYKNHQVSASVLKHDLQMLRQIAKVAARLGYIPNGNLWDDVKVKVIAGVNKKIVEPLTIEAQRELLTKLANTPHHDIALLLLITGMRIGELETLKPNSIQNGVLVLHGEGIGNYKPLTGKSASASRTLPVCPTLIELFNRGEIFKTNRNAFRLALNRNFKGVHAHRLRHSFAVNKLLAQTPLQMVSYQMGHNKTDLTADLYGKFVPEHFKAGFEETIKIRKEHLDYLENHYFFTVNNIK